MAHVEPEVAAADPGLLRGVVSGDVRLTAEQAFELYREMPLAELGRWADARCRRIHGDAIRTYVIDRNINYTNVCTARCTFCAFRRDADDHDAYTLSREQLHEKIAQLSAIGGTQILLQGGMNPALDLDWYLDTLASIKEHFPHIHVHGFSPPEFMEFIDYFKAPGSTLEDRLRWVMQKMREAGLDSIPGGGGEIFAHPVRRKIGLGKCDAEAWLTTMYVAHGLGMFTSATMMFGHIEGIADRIHHMSLVRQWQDKAMEAGSSDDPFGHYVSFIAWPFQRENTPLGRLGEWEEDGPFPGDVAARLDGKGDAKAHAEFGRRLRLSGAADYLRTQAVSRLFLDNVYSIGASWVTMGPQVGQIALAYGANDLGSVMMEENVVSAAGTTYCLDEAYLCHLIRGAGFTPAKRDNTYDLLATHDGPDSPDLAVSDWAEHRAGRLHIETPGEGGNNPGAAEVTVGMTE
jgi:cyclic dehypoxanthinyl futalosine synthase